MLQTSLTRESEKRGETNTWFAPAEYKAWRSPHQRNGCLLASPGWKPNHSWPSSLLIGFAVDYLIFPTSSFLHSSLVSVPAAAAIRGWWIPNDISKQSGRTRRQTASRRRWLLASISSLGWGWNVTDIRDKSAAGQGSSRLTCSNLL